MQGLAALIWPKTMEMPGFEPGASYMRSKRSTAELHPLHGLTRSIGGYLYLCVRPQSGRVFSGVNTVYNRVPTVIVLLISSIWPSDWQPTDHLSRYSKQFNHPRLLKTVYFM